MIPGTNEGSSKAIALDRRGAVATTHFSRLLLSFAALSSDFCLVPCPPTSGLPCTARWSRAVFQRHATFSVFLTLRETSSSRTVADCWLSEEEHGDRGVASEADNRRSDCCLLEQLFPQVERHFLSHLPHLFRGSFVFYRSISPFLFTLHSYASAMA